MPIFTRTQSIPGSAAVGALIPERTAAAAMLSPGRGVGVLRRNPVQA
jgi:hypothetical protein